MCSRRNFLLFVCSMQMLTIIERQVFDFFGYMFAPILANFLHIIFIIFGLFGAYQYRGKYLASYSVWNIIWMGWNVFLICFYLNVGILDRNSDILNLGTGSVSWFEANGPGCKPIFSTNVTLEDPFRPIRPDRVEGCYLDYWIIEIIHSAVQIFFTLLGIIGAICIGCLLWDDDDSFEFMGNDIKSPQHMSVHPMYVSYTSIPTGSASSTQINPKKDSISNNQFGVVLTSINNNTNSLSSQYIKTHNGNMLPSSLSNLATSKNPSSSLNHHYNHHPIQSPTHYQSISEHRQLSSSSNLSQYNSRNNLLSKSASTQQIIRRNPSFNNNNNNNGIFNGTNRSDIRYTEVNTTTTDDPLERDVDTCSNRSYFMQPSSQASTAAASPITSNKLMAVNWQQQQLISRNFGIQQNPLNHLVDSNNGESVDVLTNSPSMSIRSYSPSATPKNLKAFPISPDKLNYACVTRSPNLNHMPRRRPLPPIPQQVETSYQSPPPLPPHSPSSFCDQIRDKPGSHPRINLNQFLPEYNGPNPLPAIPPHMLQHPMYRVRSQDRISNRLKRQSGAHHSSGNGAYQHEHQRPRSFCNNMINYQDYKDMQ